MECVLYVVVGCLVLSACSRSSLVAVCCWVLFAGVCYLLMFVRNGCRVLFVVFVVVCGLSCVVCCCLLCVGCWLLVDVRCWLFVGVVLLFDVCCALFAVVC